MYSIIKENTVRYLLVLLGLLLFTGRAIASNTWYVSTTGSNAAAGTSVGAAWQTIAFAVSNASVVNGDTIYVEHGTYKENSGSNYLSVTKSLTIQTDPTDLVNGKAVLQANATPNIRVLNVSATNVSFVDFVFDDQAQAIGACILQGNVGTSFTRCDLKNVGTSSTGFQLNSANGSLTLDKCTMTTGTNGNSTSSSFISLVAAGWSVTVKGCTVSGMTGGAGFGIGSNQNLTLLRTTISSDGTRNTFSNLSYGIRVPNATTTTLDIEDVDFSSINSSNAAIWDSYTTTATVSSATIAYCTMSGSARFLATGGTWNGNVYANSYTGTTSLIYGYGAGFSNINIYNNTITQSGATADPISIPDGGSGIKVYNNTITTDVTTHVIAIGNDGEDSLITNTGPTNTINLGDSTADMYYYQPFTTPASTSVPNLQTICSVQVSMTKIGSPTGTITCYLYNDNAGKPGTLLDTSEYTMNAANLTGSSQLIEFWFPNHDTLSFSTQYHFVVKYTGTANASNYVSIDGNTNATHGGSSADGVTWGTAGNYSSIFNVSFLPFTIVDPEIHDNTITLNLASNQSITHCCFMGGTLGGKIYRNLIFKGALSLIFKMCDGSNGSHPLLCYDNLVYATNGGSGTMYDKGSRSAQFLHNTIINRSQNSAPVAELGSDFGTNRYNAQGSQNAVIENNIIYQNTTPASVLYDIGTTTSNGAPTCVNPTIDYNEIYAGSGTNYAWDNRSGSINTVTTFSNWQALGFDLHGKNIDPLLKNELTPSSAIDFIPNSTSPTIGMGTNLTSIVPNDYYSNAFLSSGPTVGAMNQLKRSISPQRVIIR